MLIFQFQIVSFPKNGLSFIHIEEHQLESVFIRIFLFLTLFH